jgi:exopolyphosphatase/guanosine-5'-triphosphate,3'-diphosphate pyrophosphatase
MTDKSSRLAAIDLGTNTFVLSVAEFTNSSFTLVHRETLGVAFGENSMQSGEISNAALKRAIEALNYFKSQAANYACEKIVAVTTEVMRNAKNKEVVLNQLLSQTQIPVEMISGIQEARSVARAANYNLNLANGALILDLGGGSVEIIEIENNAVQKLASFPLGVSRLLELKQWSNPLSEEDIHELNNHFEAHCGDFLNSVNASTIIGTSGIFETIVQQIFTDLNAWNSPLDLDVLKVELLLERWMKSSYTDREVWIEVIQVRRKSLHIAATLVLWLMKKIKPNQVVATPYSLAEGVLLEQFLTSRID